MAADSIRQIQQALKQQGFDPGDIDGIWGRNTIGAVRKFQQQHGLQVDGIVSPETMGALLGRPASEASGLVWFEEAKRLVGTREAAGDANNAVIMHWADDLDIHYQGDDVPWCGLFVAHCIGATLPGEALANNPLGARSWEKFGDPTTPRLGSVMVFWRESPNSGLGHVGFYNGEDPSAYQILGGNQSDQVNLAWVAKTRLVGSRWPRTARSLTSTVVMKTDRNDGRLSENEA